VIDLGLFLVLFIGTLTLKGILTEPPPQPKHVLSPKPAAQVPAHHTRSEEASHP